MRRLALMLAGGISSAVLVAGAGQTPTQTPTFRAGIDVIQVDVSVLDRAGNPVRGLDAADFTILENGRPQEIVAFVPIDVPEPARPTAPWLRDVLPDVRSNTLGDGRLFAIVMDDATMPPDARIAADARRIGRNVIERLGPDDLAAVIHVMSTRQSVDFTNDRARLLAGVEAFQPTFAFSDQTGNTDGYLSYSSIRTLGQVAAHLATVPQRRKAIVYVSTGVPVDIERAAQITEMGPEGTPGLGEPIEGGTLADDVERDLIAELNDVLKARPQDAYGAALQEAFVRAQHGNVNIYSVDPAGVGGLQAFLQNRGTVLVDRLASVTEPHARPLRDPLDIIQRARLHRDYLRLVAEQSGGRAILATNDLERGVAQIFRENSSYYLIGYRSTRDRSDRTVRRVTVRVGRPGLTARTRNAYFNPRARVPRLATPVPVKLTDALSGILPKPDITMHAGVAPFRLAGTASTALALVVGIDQPVPPGDAGARVAESLALLTSAFTPAGEPRGTSRQNARVVGRAGVADQLRYEVLSRIDLPPGRYQLRLAAHSAALDRSGSVYVDVEVPDLDTPALSLSGLILSATPALVAAPEDALAPLLPIVPTSRRAFGGGDRVLAYLQVYLGRNAAPGPVAVTFRLIDDRDTIVHRLSASLEPAAFAADGGAGLTFEVPLARLAPGPHLLTVEAALGGRTARRDVRFIVDP